MEDKGIDIEPFYANEERDRSVIFDSYYILETILTSPYPQVVEFDPEGRPKFLKESRRFHEEKCFKYLTKKQIRGQHVIWRFQDMIVKLNLNKNTPFISYVYNKVFYLLRRIYD